MDITQHIHLAKWFAGRFCYTHPWAEMEDVLSLCYLALLLAARGHNPERGKFSTYYHLVARREVARSLGYNNKTWKSAKAGRDCVTFNESEGAEFDRIPAPQEPEPVDTDLLHLCMKNLDKRSRRIIKLRYYTGLNLQEIGEKCGLCRERIRQIVAESLETMRVCA